MAPNSDDVGKDVAALKISDKPEKPRADSAAPASTGPEKGDPNISANHMGGDMWVVKPVPGAGYGAVALRKIARGERIMADAPLFVVPTTVNDVKTMAQIIALGLKKASKDQAREFLTLDNAHKANGPLVGTASTNVHPMGGGGATEAGLFLAACRINHACVPNAQNNARHRGGRGDHVDVLAGAVPWAERQTILKEHFGFVCACATCSLPAGEKRDASDKRRKEINELDEKLGDGKRIVKHAEAMLHDAWRKLRLLREEGITDAWVSRAYHDAFQIAIANGDQARAKVFAERDYEATVAYEGKDSPEAAQTMNWVKNPKAHPLYSGKLQWKQGVDKIPKDLSAEEFEKWLFRLPQDGLTN
ncbi:SET domain-containing protein 5 [Apiospora rasikravindrae]|uniref:SET domain-containing protein 5 n=1 Tax=Apiospora rasikravindrae TaxID=990691 RepID=A0ABR1TXU8_9PEZI